MQHRFAPTTFLICGGLLAWMAAFMLVYVFAAVACARGFADIRIMGLPIVPLFSLLTAALAGAATVWVFRRGYRLKSDAEMDEHTRFIGFVTFATAGLALVALVLLAMPAVFVDTCARQ